MAQDCSSYIPRGPIKSTKRPTIGPKPIVCRPILQTTHHAGFTVLTSINNYRQFVDVKLSCCHLIGPIQTLSPSSSDHEWLRILRNKNDSRVVQANPADEDTRQRRTVARSAGEMDVAVGEKCAGHGFTGQRSRRGDAAHTAVHSVLH